MTSSVRDRATVDAYESGSIMWMESLLADVASSPDFRSAADLALARFGELAGSSRGYVLLLDDAARLLVPALSVGYDDLDPHPPASRTMDDANDPFVVALLSMQVVSCGGGFPDPGAVQRPRLVVVPFPQTRTADAPRFIDRTDADRRLPASCSIAASDSSLAWLERPEATALSPYGVFVLETDSLPAMLNRLAAAAQLAGPMLSRLAASDAHHGRAEELADQRAVLTSIVNSLPDPIVIIDGDRQIVVQNQRAENLLSMSERDSEGRRRAVEINNLLLTSHLSKDVAAAGTSAAAGARELNMVNPEDGTDLLFEVLTQTLDENENAIVSVLRDVTDLRGAANELELQMQRVRLAEYEAKRESDRLNLILTNVADPILVTDDRANIILMNRRAEVLFGSAAPAIGHTGNRAGAVRANDTKFTTFISDFSLSPELSRREDMALQQPGDDSTTIPMEVVAGKILDRRGESLAIVSVLHDLTEQAENERLYDELKNFSNELEARVRAATSDLGEQNLRLQWQSRELEKANRLKSEFLASMSHELRTPINALIGYTALMLDRIYGDLNDRQAECLVRIRAAAQHLLALINDILDLAKIEAGRMPLHLEDTVLQELIREASVQIDPLIKKKGLAYRWMAPDEPLHMMTDRTKVKQIMLNLLSNAVKFTHAGTVTLSAQQEGDLVRLDVADSGIGIRREDLSAIWDDFRQVDQSRTREFGGTGLGLSITRKLAGALGGRVTLASEYGKGSTFTIFLPIQTEPHGDRDG